MEQTGVLPPDSARRTLLRGSDAIREAVPLLVDRALREVALFAPQLPAEIFNTVAFSRALASFAARHPRNRGRVLLDRVDQALRDNDRLVAIARRLSDTILVRQVSEDDRGNRDIVLLIDHAAYVQQPDCARAEAIVDTHGGRPLAELVQRFDAMWERSEPAWALRPLGL